MITKNIIHGIFSDEVPLIEACKKLRSSGIRINEVYTPFPLHGKIQLLAYQEPVWQFVLLFMD